MRISWAYDHLPVWVKKKFSSLRQIPILFRVEHCSSEKWGKETNKRTSTTTPIALPHLIGRVYECLARVRHVINGNRVSGMARLHQSSLYHTTHHRCSFKLHEYNIRFIHCVRTSNFSLHSSSVYTSYFRVDKWCTFECNMRTHTIIKWHLSRVHCTNLNGIVCFIVTECAKPIVSVSRCFSICRNRSTIMPHQRWLVPIEFEKLFRNETSRRVLLPVQCERILQFYAREAYGSSIGQLITASMYSRRECIVYTTWGRTKPFRLNVIIV